MSKEKALKVEVSIWYNPMTGSMHIRNSDRSIDTTIKSFSSENENKLFEQLSETLKKNDKPYF